MSESGVFDNCFYDRERQELSARLGGVTPEVTSDRFYTIDQPFLEVMDFDKNIGDTRHLQRTLEADVELHGIDSDALREARQSRSGFDTVKYLRDEAGATKEQLADIRKTFYKAVGRIGVDNFFLPGAREALAAIDVRQLPMMILTTGGGDWQFWKLRALGLHTRPFHVTSGRQKAEQLAYSFNPKTGLYEFDDVTNLPNGKTGYRFANFRMTDDNELAFVNMPRDAVGYHVLHDQAAFNSTGAELPENVHRVPSLHEYSHDLRQAA